MRSIQQNTVSDDGHILRNISVIPFVLILILVLSGCSGAGDTPVVTETPSQAVSGESVADGKEDTSDTDKSSENTSKEDEASPEVESVTESSDETGEDTGAGEDAGSFEMSKDRILAGIRTLHYIEDDGSLRKLLDVGENRIITYADACKNYFAVVCKDRAYDYDEAVQYTLFLIDRDENINETPIYIPEGYKAVGSFSMFGERFTYKAYGDEDNVYTYDPSGDAFLVDEALTDVQKKMNQEMNTGKIAMIYGISAPALLERTGRIDLYNSDGIISSYDTRFREMGTWKSPYKGSYSPMTADATICTEYIYGDGNTETQYNYHAINIEKRSVTDYDIHNENVSVSDFAGFSEDNRTLYYISVSINDDYAAEGYSMRAAKPASDRSYYDPVIFEVKLPAGFDGYELPSDNGIETLPCRAHLYNGYVYYLNYADGQGFVWYKAELAGKEKSGVPAGAADSDMLFKKYGDIVVSEDHRSDPQNDDFAYFRATYQSFKVNDTVKNADIINRKLDEYAASVRAFGNECAQSAAKDYNDADTGQWMRDYKVQYSFSSSFSNIEEVAGHYLQLEFDSYEYWGGAHGMPGRIFLLFDLDTGERLTIGDIFKGTEEEFKEAVAKRTLDLWKTDGGYFYTAYDEPMEDAQFETFEGSANTGMCIRFMDDGITAYYSPYDVGPFASGYIGVFVPYEDLNIDM